MSKELIAGIIAGTVQGDLEKFSGGASGADVYRFENQVIKIGRRQDLKASQIAYSRLRQSLSQYDRLFPRIEFYQLSQQQYASVAEYLGKDNLEDTILQADYTQPATIATLGKVNGNVLTFIHQMFDETKVTNPSEKIQQSRSSVDAQSFGMRAYL